MEDYNYIKFKNLAMVFMAGVIFVDALVSFYYGTLYLETFSNNMLSWLTTNQKFHSLMGGAGSMSVTSIALCCWIATHKTNDTVQQSHASRLMIVLTGITTLSWDVVALLTPAIIKTDSFWATDFVAYTLTTIIVAHIACVIWHGYNTESMIQLGINLKEKQTMLMVSTHERKKSAMNGNVVNRSTTNQVKQKTCGYDGCNNKFVPKGRNHKYCNHHANRENRES